MPSAPRELIKAAYKALAKIYLPNVQGDGAKMVEINQAYETLTQGS
jgi:curved DNA-binding protein CbpA